MVTRFKKAKSKNRPKAAFAVSITFLVPLFAGNSVIDYGLPKK